MKNSKYTITFEYIEERLMKLKEDYQRAYLEFENHFDFMETTILTKVKRLERVDEILEALNLLLQDVNKRTEVIVQSLYIDGKSFEEVAELLNDSPKRIMNQHFLIVEEIMEILGYEFKNKSRFKKRNRSISTEVKNQVLEKCNHKCVRCQTHSNLHFHHIVRFADGGEHSVENLILLCQTCHAEEHKNDTVYKLMKSKLARC